MRSRSPLRSATLAETLRYGRPELDRRCLLPAIAGGAGWAHQQSNFTDNSGAGIVGTAGTALAFGANVTQGDVIVAASMWLQGTAGFTPTFTDSAGTPRVTFGTPNVWLSPNGIYIAMAWGNASSTGACTPKVTWNDGTSHIMELGILDLVAPTGTVVQDGVMTNATGTGAAITTPLGGGSGSNDALINFVQFGNNFSSFGGSWTAVTNDSGDGCGFLLNAAGNSAPNCNQAASAGFSSAVLALKVISSATTAASVPATTRARALRRGVRDRGEVSRIRQQQIPQPTIVRPTHTTIIGLVNSEGWGTSQAVTIRSAGIRWNRIELGVGDPVASAAAGFQTQAIVANSLDATLLTTLSPATQAALAVSQLQAAAPNVQMAEFINEPDLKGGQAWPVFYGRLYMAALQALRQNGIQTRLMFAATGDYFNEASTASCSFSSGQPVATMASTDSIYVGQSFTGTNVPGGATVLSIDSATQFTSSANFSGAGPQTLSFASGFSQVDQPGGGWVGRACLTVPGLTQAISDNGIVLHPYGRPTEDTNGHSSGFAGAQHILDRLAVQLGTTVYAYLTEVGFNIDGSAPGQTTGANCYDMTEQASLTDAELQAVVADPRFKGVWIFQSHNNTGVGLGWGMLEDSGTARPAFPYLSAWAQAEQPIVAPNNPPPTTRALILSRGVRDKSQMTELLLRQPKIVPPLSAPQPIALGAVAAQSSTTAAVFTSQPLPLGAVAAQSATSATISAPQPLTFSSSAQSNTSVAISTPQPLTLSSSAQSTTSVAVTTPGPQPLTLGAVAAQSTTSATITTPGAQPLSLSAVAAQSTTSAIIRVQQPLTLSSSAQSITSISIRTPQPLSLVSNATSGTSIGFTPYLGSLVSHGISGFNLFISFGGHLPPSVVQTYQLIPSIAMSQLVGATCVTPRNGWTFDIHKALQIGGGLFSVCDNSLKVALDLQTDILERIQ